ncbi:hypothetical protein ACMWDS_31860, partial [Klebsiella pneumoniae]
PGVIFFCISDTLVPTTYLVDTTLSYASDYDQTALAGRLLFIQEFNIIKGHLNFAPPRTSLLSLDKVVDFTRFVVWCGYGQIYQMPI